MTSDGGTRHEPLFRVELGAHLRELRHRRGERLADTARRAGISTQYLSEIERGRKDPSSEMIEAVAVALGSSAGEVAVAVGQRMQRVPAVAVLSPSTRPMQVPTAAGRSTLALAA